MSSLDITNLFDVKGLVVVITGGGSGLGLMVAKALDANGAKAVYIFGRRKESLEKAASQCPNGTVIPVVGDVTSKDSLSTLVDRVKQEHGFVNVILANSGVLGSTVRDKLPRDRQPTLKEYQDALWSVPVEDFTNTFHVNCTGAFYTAVAFLELLDAGNKIGNVRQKSQVLIMGSIAGFNRSLGDNPSYPASKAAIHQVVKTLATSLAKYKIRVNAIAPGLYPSEMTAPAPGFGEGMRPSEEGGLPYGSCPLERAGSAEDMAATALFMMGFGGGYQSGNVVVTDGGRLGQIPATY